MRHFYDGDIQKSPRIQRLIDHLYTKMPEIEADRAVILTESYRSTEGEPIISRRAKAFQKSCEEQQPGPAGLPGGSGVYL